MKHKEIELGITTLLEQNVDLHWDRTQSHVIHLPFHKSREQFFFLVNLYVKPDLIDREKLVNQCILVARIAIGSGFLTDEKGVEIAGWSFEQSKRRRVVRLSILDTAYPEALKVDATDLLSKQFDGISCQWPLQPSK